MNFASKDRFTLCQRQSWCGTVSSGDADEPDIEFEVSRQ